MEMQERKANILINKAGGTAGPEGKTYRVALPAVWVKQFGITEEDREVLLQFDGECITIRRAASTNYDDFMADARGRGHDLLTLHFYDGEMLCTKICADRTTRRLAIENLVSDPLSTAFRCIPRQRDGLQYYLAELGLDQYDPLAIIRKTDGRMAEDACWIKIMEG